MVGGGLATSGVAGSGRLLQICTQVGYSLVPLGRVGGGDTPRATEPANDHVWQGVGRDLILERARYAIFGLLSRATHGMGIGLPGSDRASIFSRE